MFKMFLKLSFAGLFFLLMLNAITVSGLKLDKREDSDSTTVGSMIGKLISKLFGRNSNETEPSSQNSSYSSSTSTTMNFTQSSITSTSTQATTTSQSTTTTEQTTSSRSTMAFTSTAAMPLFTYKTEPPEPEKCYVDPFLESYCTVPKDFTDISFWDLYSVLFSDVVLDALSVECSRGYWCLQDRFDYWDAMIAERVDMVMKSEIATIMCHPGLLRCIANIPDNYTECSIHEQMVYTEEAIYLICKLKRSPEMTSECYERTLQALHVTLADIVRGKHKNEETETKDDFCQQPEAHMTRGLICLQNSCPEEAGDFMSFQPWSWFTSVVYEVIEECNLDTTGCEGLLQRSRIVWLYVIIGVSIAASLTLLLMIFVGCTLWRRYRRNVVIKEGYQQLLNEGDES